MACSVNKRHRHSWSFCLLFLFALLAMNLRAQEELKPAHGDEARWEEAKKGRDYQEIAGPKNEPKDLPDVPKMNFEWVKYVLIILLILVVIFLLVKLLSRNANNKVLQADRIVEAIDKADENLAASDLEKLLKQALDAKEFRSAIRVRYLMILKDLDSQQMIKHRKDKTNMAYVMELDNSPSQAPFLRLTRVFEFVWYGDKQVTQGHYSELEPFFLSFAENLKTA